MASQPPDRILIVDDDKRLLRALKRDLSEYFDVDVADEPERALELMEVEGPYAVVCADMKMPMMNGIEFLNEARALAPETITVMLTGDLDQQTAVQAVNEGGVFRFINKPCSSEVIADILKLASQEYQASFLVGKNSGQILSGSSQMIESLVNQVAPRPAGYFEMLDEAIGIICAVNQIREVCEIQQAGRIAEFYKAFLPNSNETRGRSSRRPGSSLREQRAIAAALAKAHDALLQLPPLSPVARMMYYHMKNYDGSGIPRDDIKGEDIPIGARVLKFAIDFCGYRLQRLPVRHVLTRMYRDWTKYDPKILDVILQEFGAGDSEDVIWVEVKKSGKPQRRR